MAETKDILVRGLPIEIAEKLEAQAKKNLRSTNKEAILIIKESLKKEGK